VSPSQATRACDSKLRKFDGVDVFALSPNEVLVLARALTSLEPRLRPGYRPLRLQLRKAGHLGRVYSRAYREHPDDESLPQEAAFENSLLDLRRVARKAGVRACSVKLAS
jgi:hypothetical protein